jgi:hypothetical protein
MSQVDLEHRVEALERELAQIKRQLENLRVPSWFEKVAGSFRDDPEFGEILRLGQQFRREHGQAPRPEGDDDAATQS